MIVLLVILGILLLLFLLTLLPLRVAVAFREEFTVELGWLWFRFPLWPQEEQPSQEESPPEEGAPGSPWSKVRRGIEKVRALLRKRGLSGLLETLGELSRLLKDSAGKLGRRVRLREFDLYVCLGGEEGAALAAIQYGQVSGAVYAACGVILSLLPCKKAGVTVDLDYGSRETTALFSARASILPLFLLGEAWHLFWNGLPLLRKLQAAGNIPPRGKKG